MRISGCNSSKNPSVKSFTPHGRPWIDIPAVSPRFSTGLSRCDIISNRPTKNFPVTDFAGSGFNLYQPELTHRISTAVCEIWVSFCFMSISGWYYLCYWLHLYVL